MGVTEGSHDSISHYRDCLRAVDTDGAHGGTEQHRWRGVLGGAAGAIIGGAVTGKAGGAVAGGIIGAAAGAMLGSQLEPRPGGYYWYDGRCWIRYGDGSYHRVSRRYCS
jgi:hypothetical protein